MRFGLGEFTDEATYVMSMIRPYSTPLHCCVDQKPGTI